MHGPYVRVSKCTVYTGRKYGPYKRLKCLSELLLEGRTVDGSEILKIHTPHGLTIAAPLSVGSIRRLRMRTRLSGGGVLRDPPAD